MAVDRRFAVQAQGVRLKAFLHDFGGQTKAQPAFIQLLLWLVCSANKDAFCASRSAVHPRCTSTNSEATFIAVSCRWPSRHWSDIHAIQVRLIKHDIFLAPAVRLTVLTGFLPPRRIRGHEGEGKAIVLGPSVEAT